MLDTALAVVNVVLGLIVLVSSLYYYKRINTWIKIYYAIMGVYWAAIYLFVLFLPPDAYQSLDFAHRFIRPGITLTLGALAASSLIGVKKRLEIWNGSS